MNDSTAAAGSSARTGGVVDADERSAVSRISQVLRQLKCNPASRVGLYAIGLVTSVALAMTIDTDLFDYQFAATLWYHPENDPSGSIILPPPVGIENSFGAGTWARPLGTDHRDRGVLVRLMYGTRIVAQVGLIAMGIGMTIGTVVGAVPGYYGGWVDDVPQWFVESLYVILFLTPVIAIMSAFGRELGIAIIGALITTIPVFTRPIRSQVLSIRGMGYVEAAKVAGARDRHITFRHVIPNSSTLVLVQSTLQVGVNILIVVSLPLLGFGAQPPTPSWGQMLVHSRQHMIVNSWSGLWLGLEVLATVVGFNLPGGGLRDTIGPWSND